MKVVVRVVVLVIRFPFSRWLGFGRVSPSSSRLPPSSVDFVNLQFDLHSDNRLLLSLEARERDTSAKHRSRSEFPSSYVVDSLRDGRGVLCYFN